jgi:arylsulfatase A-like enzyme
MAQPDVYVIVLDTARAAEAATGMPWLAAWAAREAVAYPRGMSVAPWTLPAHASLFTGRYPSEHGAHELRHHLGPALPTMAEWFQEQGYRTAAVSANGWVSPEIGLGRGFDEFVRVWQLARADTEIARVAKASQHLPAHRKAMRVVATRRPADALNMSYRWLRRRLRYGDFAAGSVNRQALLLAAEARSAPLFLFVNYMEAHAPYWGPARYRRKLLPPGVGRKRARRIPQSSSRVNAGVARLEADDLAVLRALYLAELRYLDERLQQLLCGIEERRGLGGATVVVLSDHGDNIGEHGLLGHNYSVWETLLHVPLLVRFPDGEDAGRRDPRLAQTVDVLPTVAEAVGGRLGARVAGRSLRTAEPRDLAVAEYLGPMPSLDTLRRKYPGADVARFDRAFRALRTADDEKLIWDSTGEHHLYDLAADPAETVNLAVERPERSAELASLLTGWVHEHAADARASAPDAPMDDDIRRQLEAMGYLAG